MHTDYLSIVPFDQYKALANSPVYHRWADWVKTFHASFNPYEPFDADEESEGERALNEVYAFLDFDGDYLAYLPAVREALEMIAEIDGDVGTLRAYPVLFAQIRAAMIVNEIDSLQG
ncbi:hypothetical protein D9M72_372120 [compost metagenome]